MKRSRVRRHFLAELLRAVSWHRRKLAVVAAVAAVLVGVNAAAPPDPPSTEVVMTASDLPAGSRVSAGDLTVRRVPQSLVPSESVSRIDELVGRTLVAAVPARSVLTRLSVLSARTAQTPGRVIAPIELGDGAVVALLRTGDVIDLVAIDSRSGESAVAVRGARVVTVPQPDGERSLTAPTSTEAGSLVLVEVTESEATLLARAATAGQLSVILH